MRIGIDARLMYYSPGGIAEYTRQLVQALMEVDAGKDDGDEFTVLYSRKDQRHKLNHPRFQARVLWTPSHHRLEAWTLGLELHRLALDVLHSPDFIPPRADHFHRVITVHDLAFLLYPHFLTKDSARYYGQIDQAVRQADHIIAVSESTKRDTMKLLGVPDRKISVIYEAANPIFRRLEAGEARKKLAGVYDLPDGFILFVSTIEPRKNVATLLQAFRKLKDDYHVPHKLVLAGRKGWLFDDVFASIASLNLENECIFLGQVPVTNLLYLYNAADLLVHPAFYEGFGLPPLEAMACGTPVVTSNVSALPEIVGDAGLLVDPNDIDGLTVAIWRALTDRELRAGMVERGLGRASKFSWQRAARETLDVYHQVGKRKA
jgi:glycosyltransferase involved in cell wall biosynthesis